MPRKEWNTRHPTVIWKDGWMDGWMEGGRERLCVGAGGKEEGEEGEERGGRNEEE